MTARQVAALIAPMRSPLALRRMPADQQAQVLATIGQARQHDGVPGDARVEIGAEPAPLDVGLSEVASPRSSGSRPRSAALADRCDLAFSST
jgi:hypothetical protein